MRYIEDGPKICVTIGMRANLGNYESADCSICLSGVQPGTSQESIEEMLDTGKIMFNVLRKRLKDKIDDLKSQTREARYAGD